MKKVVFRRIIILMTDTLLIRAIDFAAQKHRAQRRKGNSDTPYINHVIDVLHILHVEAEIHDSEILCAAVLHDTIEDTETSYDEITALFGVIIANLVMEVTDDKTLPKDVCKQLQISKAGLSSHKARCIKLADKIANVRDLIDSPPSHWPMERVIAYIDWSMRVVEGLRGTHEGLEGLFDSAHAKASITYPDGDSL